MKTVPNPIPRETFYMLYYPIIMPQFLSKVPEVLLHVEIYETNIITKTLIMLIN
ncbi:MAG UNVERIFIED_CONTAM: hypothetical protein LVQ98_02870 [Rickettsiaceae bacterium]